MALVRKLTTDEEILAARRVMRQLRPQIAEEAYLSTVLHDADRRLPAGRRLRG